MKASLKFRDDQKPLIRAKTPVNILGIPFQSGVVAGNADELTLNLSTAFNSGPSLRFSYRPNDPANPLSLSLKTGSGTFGSSLSLSAHFNLLHHRNGTNPDFTLNVSPSWGDFSVKKKIRSLDFDSSLWRLKKVGDANGVRFEGKDSSMEFVENPNKVGFGGGIGRFRDFGRNVVDRPAFVTGLLSGMEVRARSEVPITGRAVVTCRWSVRVPQQPEAIHSTKFSKFPSLVLNKIGIEHLYCHESDKGGKNIDDDKNTNLKLGMGDDGAKGWYLTRRQMDMMKDENGELRKAMDDLKSELASKFYGEASQYGIVKSDRCVSNADRKSLIDVSAGYPWNGVEGDVSQELKMALMGGAGA